MAMWTGRGLLVTAVGTSLAVAGVAAVAIGGSAGNASKLSSDASGLAYATSSPGGHRPGHRHHHHPQPTPTSTTPTPTATPTTASPSPSSPTTTAPAAPIQSGFPNSGNTGVPSGTSLKVIDGNLKVTTAGTVISGVDVHGSIIVDANNVTIKDSRVRCAGVSDWCVSMGGSNGVLSNTEIGGGTNGTTYSNTAVGIWTGGDTGSARSTVITAVNVHHLMHGLRVDGSSTIQNSYIHDLSYADGVHSDGSFNSAGANVVYNHNTFVGGNNSLIFMQPLGGSPIKNIMIENNNFVAETVRGEVPSYGIGVDPRVSGVSVVNNVFSKGPWEVAPGSQNFPWAAWSGNTFASSSAVVAKP
jgi:hypothetical protein